MGERKMRKMQIIVERKYLTEDSEVRLSLSLLREKIWSKIKRICKKAIYLTLRILMSAVITLPFGVWAIEYAYIERGYQAYGGEYLLIMWIFVIAFWVTSLKIK